MGMPGNAAEGVSRRTASLLVVGLIAVVTMVACWTTVDFGATTLYAPGERSDADDLLLETEDDVAYGSEADPANDAAANPGYVEDNAGDEDERQIILDEIARAQAIIARKRKAGQAQIVPRLEPSGMTPKTRGKLAIFTHVHKAGGSTFCFLARFNGENAPGGNCNPKSHVHRVGIANGAPARFNGVVDKYIASGKTFIASEWFLPKRFPERNDVVHVTMLRNPLARTESHYAMAMSQAHSKLTEGDPEVIKCRFAPGLPTALEITKAHDDLELAARDRTYFAKTTPDNWQTRVFCGPFCAKIPFGHLTPDHLAVAKARLESTYDVVGILEKFPETATLAHDVLHWERDPKEDFAQHKGTHHGGLTVLERVERESADRPHLLDFARWFHATNQYDIELYNFARGIFKRQAEAAGIDVDMGPDVDLDFVSVNHRTTTSSELKAMLADYAQSCKTQCCGAQCGPIGKYWYRTAILVGMIPEHSSWCS